MKLGMQAVILGLGRPFRTLWRFAGAAWTRQLPPDDELFSASRRLALLGVSTPFVSAIIYWFHNTFDSAFEPGGMGDDVRLMNYFFWTLLTFVPLELASMILGMWVSRRRPQVLWWLAPQMAVLVNVILVAQFLQTRSLLDHFQIPMPNELLVMLQFLPLIGAFAFSGTWMWWVLTPTDVERVARELAAERVAREQLGPVESARQGSQTGRQKLQGKKENGSPMM